MSESFQKATLGYLVVVSIFLILYGSVISIDQIFTAGLLGALVLTKLRQIILSIPAAIFLGYEYLYGLSSKLISLAHIHIMPAFDKEIFGILPSVFFQTLLYDKNQIHWYDYLSVFLYLTYILTPILIGVLFWFKDKNLFKDYSIALLVLTYASYITYIVFPAMPPWMASSFGFIPSIQRIMEKVLLSSPYPINLSAISNLLGTTLVGAVPSIHAAYPWLTFLFLIQKYKLKGFLILPYVFAVWFSVIYLGEHYVFDIVIGVAYATAVFILISKKDFLWQKLLNTTKQIFKIDLSKAERR